MNFKSLCLFLCLSHYGFQVVLRHSARITSMLYHTWPPSCLERWGWGGGGGGEVAQQLRTPVALVEDLSSVSSTHVVAHSQL